MTPSRTRGEPPRHINNALPELRMKLPGRRHVLIGAIGLTLSLPHPATAQEATPGITPIDTPTTALEAPPIRVKSIHPRRGAELAVHVEQPATVAAYYQASLYAEISGTVTFLEKGIGHAVNEGEQVAVIRPVRPTPDEARLGSLVAPYKGVIASRSVDPGTFVPSAAVVPGAQPLVTIERNDIVTVSARMPDTVAYLVNRDTEAELYMDAYAAGPLRCRLTRIAPSLDPADRTLRVEVDIYNRSHAEFSDFMLNSEKEQHARLKGREPPQFPTGLAEGSAAHLIPGTYGRMRLTVRRLGGSPLIPSSAIVRLGGMPFLYRIQSGVARKAPVAVNLDDGTLAQVVWRDTSTRGEIRRELDESDEIVLSNQGELEDGQPVQAQLTQW